jgi:hypothetical protein
VPPLQPVRAARARRLAGAAHPLAGVTELRAPESAVSGALRTVLLGGCLDGAAASCARARRRPARAHYGLRVRSRVRCSPGRRGWLKRSNPCCVGRWRKESESEALRRHRTRRGRARRHRRPAPTRHQARRPNPPSPSKPFCTKPAGDRALRPAQFRPPASRRGASAR